MKIIWILGILSVLLFFINPRLDEVRGRNIIWYTNIFTGERQYIKL
jgi:hypothetical protein